jgi:hypothetical protein
MVIMGDSLGQIVGLNVWIQNIGYSVAKDIEIRCQLIPDASIPLKDNGVYKISFLTPKDPPIQYQVVEEADAEKLPSQQLIIEASYLNEDNKRQKPTKNVYLVRELQ